MVQPWSPPLLQPSSVQVVGVPSMLFVMPSLTSMFCWDASLIFLHIRNKS